MTTTMRKATIIVSIAIALITTSEAVAQNQFGWRGPERDGIYPETGLLKVWPADGPQLLWETFDVGKGYSSPVIAGDRLYITGLNTDGEKEIFSAFTLDGKKLYETEYGTPWKNSYPDTRTTPTIVGERAWVISGAGEVVCINNRSGEIIWKVDGNSIFGRKTGTWGTSEAPLVYDNKVIFSPGGDQTAIVALNAENGQTIWKSRTLNEISNYVSPLMITHNGKKQIVALTGKNVIGVNPATGDIEWTFDEWGQEAGARGEKISANTPLFKDGRIFVCNGYNMKSFMLELNNDATAVKLLWENEDLDTHLGGFVLLDGTIYGSNWTNNTQGNWVAVDWQTGQTRYNTPWGEGRSKGSIISADGMLYCYDERRGSVGLVRPTPEKFDLVSEFRITKGEGPHWAHPVINNGVLYIRHGNALMAFRIK
jgi:outer membrane protein assembly factor BamB